MTKKELMEALKKVGVDFDPAASKAALENLYAPHKLGSVDTEEGEEDEENEEVSPERQARWEAFLVRAKEYARKEGMLERFNNQKERGEFDVIPESFK